MPKSVSASCFLLGLWHNITNNFTVPEAIACNGSHMTTFLDRVKGRNYTHNVSHFAGDLQSIREHPARFEISRGHVVCLTYDFGETGITVTAVDVGWGAGRPARPYRVLYSDDAKKWSDGGHYNLDDGDAQLVRVNTGRITARHFQLVVKGGAGPISPTLLGCTALPSSERPTARKKPISGLLLNRALFKAALMLVAVLVVFFLLVVGSCYACRFANRRCFKRIFRPSGAAMGGDWQEMANPAGESSHELPLLEFSMASPLVS